MTQPDISVVIPCYRCAHTLAGVTEELTGYLATLTPEWEVILVDDGSPDGTGDVVEGLARAERVRSVRLSENRGKGAAVAAGMGAARGRCRVFTDADLPYRLDAIALCLETIGPHRHAVFGNRRLGGSDDRAQTLPRRAASVMVRGAVGAILGRRDVDTQCGLKAFSGPLAEALFPLLRVEGFLFDVELTLLLTGAGVEIAFVPVTLVNRDESSVSLVGTGARTIRESWQLWRGRQRRAEHTAALTRFAPPGPPT